MACSKSSTSAPSTLALTSSTVEWPLVKCGSCPTVDKWKKMRSVKVYKHYQENFADKDDQIEWEYTCVECLAKELKCTEQEAKAHIMGALATPAWARERNVKFKAAFENRRAELPGMSREGVRQLARQDLAEMLAPLAEFVARKLIQLKARSQGIEEYDKLLAELKTTKDKTKELDIIEQLEKWDAVLEKLNTPLAFADKPDAEQMMNVAQYYDEWVNTEHGKLRAWYVCLQTFGGTYPPCGTVMPSKQWKRRFDDIGSSKQRWYCVCCGSRFKVAFGMLIEVHTKGVSTFMLAEVSNKDVEDVRAMFLEKKLQPKDHKDLWNKIPDFVPIDSKDILRPIGQHELCELALTIPDFDISLILKFLDVKAFQSLPKWEWDQIFSLLQ